MKSRASVILTIAVLAGSCAPSFAQLGGLYGGGLTGGGIFGGGGGISSGILGRLGMPLGRQRQLGADVSLQAAPQIAPGQVVVPLFAPNLIVPNNNVLTFGGQNAAASAVQAGGGIPLTGSQFAQIVNQMTPIVKAFAPVQAAAQLQGPAQAQAFVTQNQPGVGAGQNGQQQAPFTEAGRRSTAAAKLSTAPELIAPQEKQQPPAAQQNPPASVQPTGFPPAAAARQARQTTALQPQQNTQPSLLPNLSLQDLSPVANNPLDLPDISLGAAVQQVTVQRVGVAQVGAQRAGQARATGAATQPRRIRRTRQNGG